MSIYNCYYEYLKSQKKNAKLCRRGLYHVTWFCWSSYSTTSRREPYYHRHFIPLNHQQIFRLARFLFCSNVVDVILFNFLHFFLLIFFNWRWTNFYHVYKWLLVKTKKWDLPLFYTRASVEMSFLSCAERRSCISLSLTPFSFFCT